MHLAALNLASPQSPCEMLLEFATLVLLHFWSRLLSFAFGLRWVVWVW